MNRFWLAALPLVLALVGGSPSARADGPPGLGVKIALLGFDALGMDDERVARLEALFRNEIERLAGAPSPSRREIASRLRGTRLGACTGENKCLAAIGVRLGTEWVVSGNVAALGDSYVVTIKVVDSRDGKEIRRIESDPLRGNPDELIDAIRVAAYRLLAPDRLKGSVTLLADLDGATVAIDGRHIGETPLKGSVSGLPLGPHKIVVKASGYSTFDESVTVRFQKNTKVVVRLKSAGALPLIPNGKREPIDAPPKWYQTTWFYVGAGVTAALLGGYIGYQLGVDPTTDCTATPEKCGF